jgi:hypothetical protein
VTFIDVGGTTTKVGSVTTGATGAFSIAVTVPGGAGPGKGKFKATGVGGLTTTAAFTVEPPS